MSDDRLRNIVERIERLMEEKHGIAEDIKDVFAEAKAVGYCTQTLRALIARRALAPADRAEADQMLETYEAALGGLAGDPAVSPDEAQRELAIAILTEQVEGISEPAHAAALAEHIGVVLDLRAEIAQLREMEKARLALAVAEGFQKNPMTALVRWIEKCAKHGADAMRASEAVFQMYRGTIEARGGAGLATPVKFDPVAEKGKQAAAGKSKAAARTAAWLATGMGE